MNNSIEIYKNNAGELFAFFVKNGRVTKGYEGLEFFYGNLMEILADTTKGLFYGDYVEFFEGYVIDNEQDLNVIYEEVSSEHDLKIIFEF